MNKRDIKEESKKKHNDFEQQNMTSDAKENCIIK